MEDAENRCDMLRKKGLGSGYEFLMIAYLEH